MRIKTTKNSFSSGEISPFLRGRTDIQQYADGVEKMNNFLIRQQGGISKRPGTKYIGEVLDQLKSVRLQRFVFNTETAYTLEFSEYKVRILKNEGFVTEVDVSISGATVANPVVVTTTSAHGYSNGDVVTITGVSGMTEINNKEYKVNNVTSTTFELQDMFGTDLDGTGYSAYTSGGVANKHIIITTPWEEDDIEGLSFAQTNNVLYVASELHKPRKISRTSDTVWTIEEIANTDGPYQLENLTDTTLTPSNTTGNGVTLTASANLFASTDVGRQVRLHHDGSNPIAGWATITAYSSATSVTVSISSAFGATTATEVWRLGAWSETTGYSSTVTFHENRLFFGGTAAEPNTFWASKTDDYENFEPSNPDDLVVADDNGLRFQIASEQNNAIQWMRSSQQLFIGTKGGQYVAKSNGVAITPSDVNVIRQNGYGSSIVEPHIISNSVIYCDRTTRKIMEMVYNFDNDAYQSNEISVIANHILRQGTRAIYTSYQQSPDNVIWYVLESGRLVGMTYLKEQKIIAFHNHDFGGTYEIETVSSGNLIEGETYRIKSVAGGADFTGVGAGSNTIGVTFTASAISPTWGSGSVARLVPGQIKAITTIPSVSEQTDLTYVVVRRTINGVNRQYIEYFEDDSWAAHDRDFSNFFYVDSGLSYSGSPISSISGLGHLEGESVTIVADDAAHANRTVSGGSITLDGSYSKLQIGLGYSSQTKLLPVDVQGDLGSAQGSTKRISKIIARFYDTLGCQAGETLSNTDPVDFDDPADLAGEITPLFTGDKNLLLNMNYNSEAGFWITQDDPFPCNILFITMETRSNQ